MEPLAVSTLLCEGCLNQFRTIQEAASHEKPENPRCGKYRIIQR